jgi:hypothetical protein
VSKLLVALFVAAVILTTTLLALAGHHPWEGPVVWQLGKTSHGLHAGDLVSLAASAVAIAGVFYLLRKR